MAEARRNEAGGSEAVRAKAKLDGALRAGVSEAKAREVKKETKQLKKIQLNNAGSTTQEICMGCVYSRETDEWEAEANGAEASGEEADEAKGAEARKAEAREEEATGAEAREEERMAEARMAEARRNGRTEAGGSEAVKGADAGEAEARGAAAREAEVKGAEARQEARGIEEREIKIETKQFQSQFPLLYPLAINPKNSLYQKKITLSKREG